MSADYRDGAFFPTLLEGCKHAVDKIATGKSDFASQRLAVKQLLDRLGYRTSPDQEGTMKDLRSDVRLNLVLDTNVLIRWGYRQWQESNEVAMGFPANELIRFGYRKVPRDWLMIWDEARVGLMGATSATESGSGRMIALKGDPIWTAISDFGVPWPPFKFNSGMGLVNVSWDECLDLGLIQEGVPSPPVPLALVPDFEQFLIGTLGEL